MSVNYVLEPDLCAAEYIDVVSRTSLATRRPLGDMERVETMLREADLIVTARIAGKLIGISRALTDYSFCTYLSDLAVDEEYQGQGVGRVLIQKTHAFAGLSTMLILIAAPAAETYYPYIGMTAHHSCWYLPRQEG